ncbi:MULTISPECIES: phage tail protein [Pseudomonas]|uniref:phage tail protein n=1 Tax=Pseudomonas TaxID=286 RepID=UPI000D882570|nr:MULTISPECIES: tail fiber protein [Pseudomonas]MBH3386945.1 phage tail protein [Pseudomonas juntendi]MBR7522573.1 phage tail protein [Pseudomonas juntendi]PYB95308.1 phage tail protein [Pseudomonas sp. MB-090624]WDM59960.1 tail fiber protein [Pseudomonas sp. NEEL19]
MSDPFIGEIKMFAGSYAPQDYAMCQGQLLPISQNAALFSLLGTTYGGNGQATFGLPHFGGRAPIGQGAKAPDVAAPFALGQAGGVENVTLLNSNMPMHTHLQVASQAMATTDKPGPNTYLAAAVDGSGNAVNVYGESLVEPTSMAPQSIQVTGGSTPFAVRNPYLAVSFIIALQGIYPPHPW